MRKDCAPERRSDKCHSTRNTYFFKFLSSSLLLPLLTTESEGIEDAKGVVISSLLSLLTTESKGTEDAKGVVLSSLLSLLTTESEGTEDAKGAAIRLVSVCASKERNWS